MTGADAGTAPASATQYQSGYLQLEQILELLLCHQPPINAVTRGGAEIVTETEMGTPSDCGFLKLCFEHWYQHH